MYFLIMKNNNKTSKKIKQLYFSQTSIFLMIYTEYHQYIMDISIICSLLLIRAITKILSPILLNSICGNRTLYTIK